ncbi:MAG: hypothetical protein HC816_01295 [Leptolyngbyaceae cyanobacterium RM1_1_2]|nr:hypothetical protein [Leptolyngbyaceae cyanobacterium RM1_1_2]
MMNQNFLETTALPNQEAIAPQQVTEIPRPEIGRVTVSGSPAVVKAIIHDLHNRRFAEPNDWSLAVLTRKIGEVMRVLLKRVWLG